MNDVTQVERLQSAPWPRPNLLRVNLTGLATIVRDPRWQPSRFDDRQAVWTDNYSSLLSIFRWR